MDRHPWRLGARGQRWFDVALVAVLLLLAVGHVVSGQVASATFAVLEALPLLWRRRHPWPVFLAVAIASAAQAVVVDEPTVGQLAFPVAVYSAARWAPRWQGITALVVGYAGALVAGVRWLLGFGAGDLTAGSLAPYTVTICAIVTAAWALGFAAQEREKYVASLVARAEQAERMAEREVELAARDERSRIAREMHDVVAHGLSVIVIQADGARYAAVKDPDVAVGTLETISTTGRESLTEMRRLLGLLRDGDTGVTPQPGLADVRHLVDEARAAGTRRAGRPACRGDRGARRHRPGGVPHRAGGADQRAQARRARRDRARPGRRRARGRDRGARRRAGRGDGLRRARPRPGRHAGAGRRARWDAACRPGGGRWVHGVCEAAAVIRVFLVDDQQMVRAGFRMLVDSQDDMVVVGEAGDGGEALERLSVSC